MSLINDMLRNLEAKRPDDLARQNLQREIRSLPAAGSAGRGGRWLLLAGLPLIGVAAALLHAEGCLLPLLGIATGEPPVAAVPLPMTPTTAPPSVPAAVEIQSAPQPAETPPATVSDQLRLAASLERVPLPVAPVLPVPDPVPPPVQENPPKAQLAETPPSPPLPAGPVKIEKSPVAATPRDRADAEFRKAETALASGRSGEALDGMRAALKLDPAYLQARQALLRQLLDAHRTDEAMAVLRDGLELQPAQTGWAMSLARLQLEQGDLATADRTLAKSQAYAEANADYAGFQGHVKSRLGAQKAAIGHYQRAVRLAPGDGRWWLGLGLAQEAEGRLPEARDALRRAVAAGNLSPDLVAIAEQHLR